MIELAPSIERIRASLGITEPWAPLEDRGSPPWFVRLALGAIAWLGGAFLLGFVAAFVPEEAAVFVGVALLAAAITLRWIAPVFLRDFWLQASLLGMVAARGALVFGLADLLPDAVGYLVMAAVEALTVLVYPGTAPRLAAVICGWTWLALAAGAPGATEGLAVLAIALAAVVSELEIPIRLGPAGWLWRPVVAGSALWSLGGLAGASPSWPGSHPWLASLGIVGVGGALAARWLHQGRAGPVTWAATGASAAALTLMGASVPGTLAGLVSTAIAFRRRDPLWLGASLAGLLLHGVYLYWQMSAPFATKGAAMIGLGLVLFAAATLAVPRGSDP